MFLLIEPLIHYVIIWSKDSNAKFPTKDYTVIMTILYPISILFLSLFTYNNNKINEIKSIENDEIKKITNLKNEIKSIENEFIEKLSNNKSLLLFPKIDIEVNTKNFISIYSLYLIKLMNFAKNENFIFKYDKNSENEFSFLEIELFIQRTEDRRLEDNNRIQNENYYDLIPTEIDFHNKKIYCSQFLFKIK